MLWRGLFWTRRGLSAHGSSICEEFAALRERFEQVEASYRNTEDLSSLSKEEAEVARAHREAVDSRHFTYLDPATGNKVFVEINKVYTRYFWYLKGECCGRGCRHCVYNLREVPQTVRAGMRFNSSFWTRKSPAADPPDLMKKIKVKPKEPTN